MDELLKYESLISAFMPLIVIILTGIWVNKRLEKLKSRFQLDHAIIQKRADSYAEIQDDINKIYSYIKRVGDWKDYTPEDVLAAKRKSDKKFHTTKPYWSKDAFDSYSEFIKVCFKEYRGNGMDAGIIAQMDKYSALPNWNDTFAQGFVGGYDKSLLENAYSALMKSLSRDFGVE